MQTSPTRGGGLYERKSAISLSYAAKSLQAQTLLNKMAQINTQPVGISQLHNADDVVISKQFLASQQWYQQPDHSQFSHSAIDVEEIIYLILKNSSKVLMDNYYTTLLPKVTLEKIIQQIDENFLTFNMKEDLSEQTQLLIEDQEPKSLGDEHWASFRVEVGTKYIKQSITESQHISNKRGNFQLARRSSRLTTPLHMQSTQHIRRDSHYSNQGDHPTIKENVQHHRKVTAEEEKIEQIRLNTNPDSDQLDPLENGMRMAYEHEVLLQAQREKLQRQREEEIKEHNKYMKQLQGGNQAKKQFTYDFEGKIIVQNGLNYEKLHQTFEAPQFNIQLISTNNSKTQDFDPNEKQVQIHLIKQKVVQTRKERKDFVSSVDSIKNVHSISQIENIVLNKGVTFYEGNNTKSGPNFNMENFDFDNQLQNPQLSLKLSRGQYEKLIRKVSFQNSHTKNTKIHIENNSSMMSIEQGSIDASIIPKEFLHSKRTNVNATSYSFGKLNGGSIRYSQDSAIGVDDLLILDSQPKPYKLPTLPTPKNQKLKDSSDYILDSIIKLEAAKTRDEKIKPPQNLKLPLKLSAAKSLPQLQKNPRDRQTSGAVNNILQSKYLPPPNVGKSIGHNYKGVRLLGI